MVCLYRERKLCDLRAVVKILKPKRSDSRIWKPLKLHSFKCRGSLKDLGEEWICDTRTHTDIRVKTLLSILWPSSTCTTFRGFLSILNAFTHLLPGFFIYYILSQNKLQSKSPQYMPELDLQMDLPVTITQTTMTANDKSMTFSPKSTKEDCPTVLNDESAGMTSTLVKFPSCENDH